MNAAMAPNGSSAKRLTVLILVLLGILAIVAGILYLAGSANSMHFMVGSTHKGHHQVRAVVSFVIGLALLAAAWFTNRATSHR
jgi:flagellar basal body-associated protein FliL